MLWTAGSFSGVLSVYLAVIYWQRASKAGKTGWQWGLGAAVVYLAIMGVIYLLIRLLASPLGLPDFLQIWISVVLWFVVTITTGIKTDSVFANKLPVSPS